MCLAISGFPLWLEGLEPPLRCSRLPELSTGELSLTQPLAQAQFFVELLLSIPACGVTQQKKKQRITLESYMLGFHSA